MVEKTELYNHDELRERERGREGKRERERGREKKREKEKFWLILLSINKILASTPSGSNHPSPSMRRNARGLTRLLQRSNQNGRHKRAKEPGHVANKIKLWRRAKKFQRIKSLGGPRDRRLGKIRQSADLRPDKTR